MLPVCSAIRNLSRNGLVGNKDQDSGRFVGHLYPSLLGVGSYIRLLLPRVLEARHQFVTKTRLFPVVF
jgi:hypothetical protein